MAMTVKYECVDSFGVPDFTQVYDDSSSTYNPLPSFGAGHQVRVNCVAGGTMVGNNAPLSGVVGGLMRLYYNDTGSAIPAGTSCVVRHYLVASNSPPDTMLRLGRIVPVSSCKTDISGGTSLSRVKVVVPVASIDNGQWGWCVEEGLVSQMTVQVGNAFGDTTGGFALILTDGADGKLQITSLGKKDGARNSDGGFGAAPPDIGKTVMATQIGVAITASASTLVTAVDAFLWERDSLVQIS
jgi:hypothetical protein